MEKRERRSFFPLFSFVFSSFSFFLCNCVFFLSLFFSSCSLSSLFLSLSSSSFFHYLCVGGVEFTRGKTKTKAKRKEND